MSNILNLSKQVKMPSFGTVITEQDLELSRFIYNAMISKKILWDLSVQTELRVYHLILTTMKVREIAILLMELNPLKIKICNITIYRTMIMFFHTNQNRSLKWIFQINCSFRTHFNLNWLISLHGMADLACRFQVY